MVGHAAAQPEGQAYRYDLAPTRSSQGPKNTSSTPTRAALPSTMSRPTSTTQVRENCEGLERDQDKNALSRLAGFVGRFLFNTSFTKLAETTANSIKKDYETSNPLWATLKTVGRILAIPTGAVLNAMGKAVTFAVAGSLSFAMGFAIVVGLACGSCSCTGNLFLLSSGAGGGNWVGGLGEGISALAKGLGSILSYPGARLMELGAADGDASQLSREVLDQDGNRQTVTTEDVREEHQRNLGDVAGVAGLPIGMVVGAGCVVVGFLCYCGACILGGK